MLSVIFIKLSAVIYCSCAKLHCADQNECHMRVHMALLLVSNAPPPPSPPPPLLTRTLMNVDISLFLGLLEIASQVYLIPAIKV